MKEKIGIIDVGGGFRGIYGAGVFDYLLDQKIEIPYCIGISAGSGNVACYLSKQKGRNYLFYKKSISEKGHVGLKNFIKNGSYIDLDYIYVKSAISSSKNPWDFDMVMKSKQEMLVVITNANTGEAEFVSKKEFKKDDYGMFAASCCIPVACKPYVWRGNEYYDGSIADPIPVKKAFEDGCDKVIVLLTRPVTMRKNDGKRKIVFRKFLKKYPKFQKKMLNRCELYNETLESLLEHEVKEGKVFIVAPDDILGMDTLTKDLSKMDVLYQKGYQDGKKIKEFLEH